MNRIHVGVVSAQRLLSSETLTCRAKKKNWTKLRGSAVCVAVSHRSVPGRLIINRPPIHGRKVLIRPQGSGGGGEIVRAPLHKGLMGFGCLRFPSELRANTLVVP